MTDKKLTVEARMVLLSSEVQAVLTAWDRPVPLMAIQLCLTRTWEEHTLRVALHWLVNEGRVRKIPDLAGGMACLLYSATHNHHADMALPAFQLRGLH